MLCIEKGEDALKQRVLQDRMVQGIGLFMMIMLTLALLFAFRGQLLPAQEDGDAFETVYAFSRTQQADEVDEAGEAGEDAEPGE